MEFKKTTKEENVIVLDFLPNGYPFDNTPAHRKTSIAQAIGIEKFTLLELVPRKDIFLRPLEKVYIGEGKREKIHHINGRIPLSKLTQTAKQEVEPIIKELIHNNEEKFLVFFNKAQPLTIRMHSLELLPGVGKKHVRELLDERLINITGVGFGSHDYCNVMQIKPTPKNLYYARNQILLMARAYNITAVDIISMETEREDVFIEEALDGFEMGYRDKFILHPVQLEWLGHVNYYTDEEVNDAINIHGKILEAKKLGTSIIVVDGQAYEKPHIQRIQTIVEWSKHNSSG